MNSAIVGNFLWWMILATFQELAHSVAKYILDKGPLEYNDFKIACGNMKMAKQFLVANVFAVRSDGLYGFPDKITEDAVRQYLGKAEV
jgi:hypothetical protein